MKIISFNSYKGGACRTTTCYNTLPYLADQLGATSHRPILVFDVDLDSMGLTNLFTNGKRFVSTGGYSAEYLFADREMPAGKNNINGQLKYGVFQNSVEGNPWFFEEAFMKVGNALGLEDDGSVLFCGADCDADSLTDSEFDKYKKCPPVETMIEKLDRMTEPPVAIVFDCAAGVQISTRAILRNANKFVMCMRPTLQFRIGTRDYLIHKIPDEMLKNLNNDKKTMVLLPTAVAGTGVSDSDPNKENAEEVLVGLKYDVLDYIDRFILNRIKGRETELGYELDETMLGYELDESMLDYELDESMTDEKFGIPEIERFKWKEELLYKQKLITRKEIELKGSYIMLAKVIAKD